MLHTSPYPDTFVHPSISSTHGATFIRRCVFGKLWKCQSTSSQPESVLQMSIDNFTIFSSFTPISWVFSLPSGLIRAEKVKPGWTSPFCGKVGVALSQGRPAEKGSWTLDSVFQEHNCLVSAKLTTWGNVWWGREIWGKYIFKLFFVMDIYWLVETFHALCCLYWQLHESQIYILFRCASTFKNTL